MKHRLMQPAVFNAIMIVGLVLIFVLGVAEGPKRLVAQMESMRTLGQLAAETDLVDEAMLANLRAETADRNSLSITMAVLLLVAILANFIANYLGRGRQHKNMARIRELEAQLGGKQ